MLLLSLAICIGLIDLIRDIANLLPVRKVADKFA